MKRRGFTLVEVMVVVVIVATLTSTVYVLAQRLLLRARIAESSNNLRNLVLANHGYEADHGIYCPADHASNNLRWHGRRTSAQGGFDPTEGLLSPYLGKSRQVTVCPLFKAMATDAASFETGTGGYGYNAAYIGGKPGGPWVRATKLRESERSANVWDPGRTVMFTTTAYATSGGLQEYPFCEPPFWDFGDGPTGMRPSPTVHFRAGGNAIVAWCDGSVTLEPNNREDEHGANPHGGDSHEKEFALGWFGDEENNGAWNPRR